MLADKHQQPKEGFHSFHNSPAQRRAKNKFATKMSDTATLSVNLSLDACVASVYRPAMSTSLIQNKLPSFGHRARKIAVGKSLAALLAVACLGSEALAVNLILDGSFENIPGVPVNNYLLFTGSLGDG